MTVMDTVRIKQHHDHSVDAEWNGYHEWINLGERLVLDTMGRRNAQLSGPPNWTKWRCNNPDCSAWAIVHDDAVRQMLEAEEARWTR